MATTEKTINVEPGGELDRLLAEANGAALILVRNGVRYRLHREESAAEANEDDPWADYDPERLIAGVRAVAGSMSEAEAERLKAYIYAGREEGSRPADGPCDT